MLLELVSLCDNGGEAGGGLRSPICWASGRFTSAHT